MSWVRALKQEEDLKKGDEKKPVPDSSSSRPEKSAEEEAAESKASKQEAAESKASKQEAAEDEKRSENGLCKGLKRSTSCDGGPHQQTQKSSFEGHCSKE